MYNNIKQCLHEYEETCNKLSNCLLDSPTEKERDIIEYFELNLAKAIISDFTYNNADIKIAKIILALKDISNEIKVKIE